MRTPAPTPQQLSTRGDLIPPALAPRRVAILVDPTRFDRQMLGLDAAGVVAEMGVVVQVV